MPMKFFHFFFILFFLHILLLSLSFADDDNEFRVIYFLQKGDFSKAEENIIYLKPLKKLYYSAFLHFKKGDFKEARVILDQLESFPEGKCPASKLKGILELTQGNPYFADKYLSDAVSCYPDDDSLKIYLCAGLLKVNDFEGFESMFESVIDFSPEEKSLKSLKSLLYSFYRFYKGEMDNAIEEISHVSYPYDNDASIVLDRMLSIKKHASFVTSEISGRVEYDTNGIFDPDSHPITLGKGEKKDTMRISVQGKIRINPFAGKNTLFFEANFLRTENFSSPADNLNMTFFDGRASYSRYFHLFGSGQGIAVTYKYSLLFLDGGRLLPEESFFAYSEKHEMIPSLIVFDYSWMRMETGYIFFISGFAQKARNSTGHNPFVSLSGYKGRAFYQGFFSYLAENAAVKGYDVKGFRTAANFGYLLPYEFAVYFGIFYDYRNHIDSAGYFDESKRADRTISLSGGIQKSLFSDIFISAGCQFLMHPSTVGSYDYSKQIISVGVSWKKY
jgi:hypothetical protein